MSSKNLSSTSVSAILVLTTFLSLAAFVSGDTTGGKCYCQMPDTPTGKGNWRGNQNCPSTGKIDCPGSDGKCRKIIIEVTEPPAKKGTTIYKECGDPKAPTTCTEPKTFSGADNENGTIVICTCKGDLCNESLMIRPPTMLMICATSFTILVLRSHLSLGWARN